MKRVLEINGKTLTSIKEAVDSVSYSRDYITRLAREGKIFATVVERQWFIDLDSLKAYAQSSDLEREVRKRQLSEERKQEHQTRLDVAAQKTSYRKQANSLHGKAVAVAMMVLFAGVAGGWGVQQLTLLKGGYSLSELSTKIFSLKNTDSVATVTESQSEIFKQALQNSAVATTVSQDIKNIGDVQQGILLLPAKVATTSVNSLFSDDVIAVQKPDGGYVVARVDEDGNTVGSEIPFVVVPVISSDI